MTNNEAALQRRAMVLMALAAMFWSLSGIFIKLLPWEPILIAGARSLIAAATTAAYMLVTKMRFRLTRWTLFTGIFVGLVCGTFVFATKMTTAANAIVLQYSSPIYVLLVNTVYFKKPLKRRDVFVVIAVLAGTALFFCDQLSPGNMMGNLIAILSGVWLAMVFLGNAQAGGSDEARMSGLVVGHALCGLLIIPGMILYPVQPTAADLVYVLILGVVQLGLPYILLVYAGKHCSALASNLIGMLEPIFNPVWVLLFYGEKPGLFALLGAAVILGSVVIWTAADARAEDEKIAEAQSPNRLP